jgi:menaquinone-dependent protoporphyrinogen IX oxidase
MAANTTEADLADYDAVIIGSPTMMGKWLPETLDFIERSADTLAAMTVAYINVNTTVADPEKAEIAYNAFIQPVLDDYPAIEPISVGLFAGEINYEEMYDQDRILLQLLRFEEGNWINLDAVDQWTSDFITELEAQ